MDIFGKLGTTRKDFVTMLRHELENGVTSEYSGGISEAIAARVARDVWETADQKEWNTCDVSLGAGRVILKAFGVDV